MNMNLNLFSSSPDSDAKNLNKLLCLIEKVKQTSDSIGETILTDLKHLINSITWKEKIDEELEFLLSDSNVNFDSIKPRLESYKTILKLKLEKIEIFINALAKDKENLKKILILIDEFNEENSISSCFQIGDLLKSISWKEDNPEYIRNKHGFRSRWIKHPNKINNHGAKINFEMLSHLKSLQNFDDWLKELFERNFNTIRSALACLKEKINYILDDKNSNQTYEKEKNACLDKLVRFLALAYANNCLERLRIIFIKLNGQRENLNLIKKFHRFYLGYELVSIGETANEIMQCLKPEIIEGKPDMANTSIELLLKYLKQCRKLIKAKPEYILERSVVLDELNNTICSNVNILVEIFNKFQSNVIVFVKDSFESKNIYDSFLFFNETNQEKLEIAVESLKKINILISKSKLERLCDSVIGQIEKENFSINIEKFKSTIIEQFTQKKDKNENDLSYKLKKFNRLLLKLINNYKLVELNSVKLSDLKIYLNDKLENNISRISKFKKKSESKNFRKDLAKLFELWTNCSSDILNYFRSKSGVELDTIQNYLNEYKINFKSYDESLKNELDHDEDETEQNVSNQKLNYSKPDGLDQKLTVLDAWDFLSHLRDFDQLSSDDTNTKKLILKICMTINEAVFYDEIVSSGDEAFVNFEEANKCKLKCLKMSFAVIGQNIKDVFRGTNLDTNVMKYYKYDTLFDYSNLTTVVYRNKIMHNRENELDETNGAEATTRERLFSCWVKTIKSILFIILYNCEKIQSKSIIYDHFIEKEISDYFKSLDSSVKHLWNTFLLMQCYFRLTAYEDTINSFEDEHVQDILNNTSLNLDIILPRIYGVYFDALNMNNNHQKAVECFEKKFKNIDNESRMIRELKFFNLNFMNNHLLTTVDPLKISLDEVKKERFVEKKLLYCFYSIEKGHYDRSYEILSDLDMKQCDLTNTIFVYLLKARCLKSKERFRETLELLNKALDVFKIKKNVCIRRLGGLTRTIEIELHLDMSSCHMHIFETTWDLFEHLDMSYDHAYSAMLMSEGSNFEFDLLSYSTSCAIIATVYARRWVRRQEPTLANYVKSYIEYAIRSFRKLNNYMKNLKVAHNLFSLCLISEQVNEFDTLILCFNELIHNESIVYMSYINALDLNDTGTMTYSLFLLLETCDLRVYSELFDYATYYAGSNAEILRRLAKFDDFFVKNLAKFKSIYNLFDVNTLLAYLNAYKSKYYYILWKGEDEKFIENLNMSIKFAMKSVEMAEKTELNKETKTKFYALFVFLYLKFKNQIREDMITNETMKDKLDSLCKIVNKKFKIDDELFYNVTDVIDYILIVEKLYSSEKYKNIYETKLFGLIKSMCLKINSIL